VITQLKSEINPINIQHKRRFIKPLKDIIEAEKIDMHLKSFQRHKEESSRRVKREKMNKNYSRNSSLSSFNSYNMGRENDAILVDRIYS